MITHNEIVTVLGGALALVVFMLGYWRGHYRAYAECCDCCTCDTCEGIDGDDELDEVFGRVREDLAAHGIDPIEYLAGDALPDRRHAILLEPGPTIYPALAELAGEVMDEPESHPDASDSTFVRKLLIEWEQRYPIPVGAP